MWLFIPFGIGLVLLLLKACFSRKKSQNPFALDSRRPPAPLVIDKAERRKVIKQAFSPDKVPQNLDAIVIGSGIGGLGVAALLAKAGKRVLVLEQLAKIGGCCHTFNEQGYEFDVGIHYIGKMYEKSILRLMADQLTEGQLQWDKMDSPFDVVVLGDPSTSKQYNLYSGEDEYIKGLKRCFPGEAPAIDKFIKLVKTVSNRAGDMVILKMIPLSWARFLIRTGLVNWLSPFFKMSSKSLTEVINELTQNEELKAIFGYIFLTYGVFPRQASFSVHAIIIDHYLEGGWYPRGGASEIAFHIIPVIKRAGGAVFARASVQSILVNEEGKAYGVTVISKKYPEPVNVFAPVVISDAGLFNTYKHLLSPKLQLLPGIQSQLNRAQHGLAGFSLFVGLRGTREELGLKATNYYIYLDKNLDKLEAPYFTVSRDEAPVRIPVVYVSFPSAKDSSHEERCPGKSTLTALTFAQYEWFEDWKEEEVKKRGADYESVKNTFAEAMLETILKFFPHLRDKIDCISSGSPLSNQHYIASSRGEFYGISHDIQRWTPESVALFRAQTDIKNLYMSGQDAFLCGFGGALNGAMVCASAVLGRNLYLDLMRLKKQIKQAKSKKSN
ncbi:all-trans-retinol 13,14-reductase isoform X1 [Microcaecilia unicolor]|uniref:All-trans-retinol 13,14-reductase n=2 Tax=Microcaecilia unicolor TaxID=1415580 RepID=A0A6P7XYJ3_9AMPH|nr:all-trans-retinol 13,14-reductase-like isoform X1 [Microcaecilia unicolor]